MISLRRRTGTGHVSHDAVLCLQFQRYLLFADISRPEKLRQEGDTEKGSPSHLGYSNPAFERGEKDAETGGNGELDSIFNCRRFPYTVEPRYLELAYFDRLSRSENLIPVLT